MKELLGSITNHLQEQQLAKTGFVGVSGQQPI